MAGCAGRNRIWNEATPAALAGRQNGIALIKHAVLGPACISQFLRIGVAVGMGHNSIREIHYGGDRYEANPASVARVTELELPPGTYHVLSISCLRARSKLTWGSMGGTHSVSLASFEVGAGEVVNVGYITAEAINNRRSLRLRVQDMPVLELKRYADERPQLYAAMVTRLAKLMPDEQQLCVLAEEQLADGKLTKMPSGC